MSTHDPGTIYADWRRMEAGDARLQAELAREQVTHPIADYTPERLARLEAQMQEAQRFRWPEQFTVNV